MVPTWKLERLQFVSSSARVELPMVARHPAPMSWASKTIDRLGVQAHSKEAARKFFGCPRLYGLPKVHKKEIPLRPIVSSLGSPTYKLAQFLARSLKPCTGNTTSNVRDSSHFIEILGSINVSPRDILVGFDVVSLFTKVPVRESLAILQRFTSKGLPPDFPKLVEFCLESNYFLWNGDIYQQTEGAAMGSPLSPAIADIFMEDLEEKALASCNLPPKCWLRCVDDTFVIWPHGEEKLEEFHRELNNINSAIKFTKELEKDGRLPFLDVLVTRKLDGTLGHSVYRKPTHTDRYLHATSHHHPQQKAGVIKTFLQSRKSVRRRITPSRERTPEQSHEKQRLR
ncbi:uncharacterized protein [Hetaerina americana]|uniref:uncharacterized protein n=1 Tax=Hetaerina americana TaxID=62018 RepID=UPI003A7F318E